MIREPQSDSRIKETFAPKPFQAPSLSERLESNPGRYLLLFSAIYLFAEFCANWHRPFWIDEIFMYNLASLPSITQIWPLIRQGIELNPPLPFWITWIVHHTLGRGEFLTRLPAILGFWGMCLCLFWYVKRRSDATHGFVALLLPLLTYTATQGTWARGYGLLLGFSAAAMLSWQFATDNKRRSLALVALAVSLAGAVSCHYYALYCAGAIAVGEFVRTWTRKRVDVPIFAAILVGVSPMVAYLQLLKAVSAGSKHFWVRPMGSFLYDSYADLFGPAAMALLIFLLVALIVPETRKRENWSPATLGIHEVAACLVFAAMPFVIYMASLFTPIAFFTKYVQPVVIGFAIAVPMFAYRVGGGNPAFRKLTITFVVWLCFAPWTFLHFVQISTPEPWLAVQARLHIPEKSNLPIVIDRDDQFMAAYQYAPQEIRDHLFFLYDPQSAIKYLGSDTGQNSLLLGQTFHDFHLVGYEDFVSREHEFLVLRPLPGGWILQRLLADGADVQLVQLNKEKGLFVEDRLLFHVTIPPGRPANMPSQH